jgi:integrase
MSIRERRLANGSLVFDVTLDIGPDPETGKRRQRRWTVTTRTNARRTEREKRAEIARGEDGVRVRVTLAAWLEIWLTTIIAVRCEGTTLTSYRWTATTRIIPQLGALPLADLTEMRIQRFIAALASTPTATRTTLSRRSIEDAYRILHMALADAVRSRLLPRNPAAGVTLPKREQRLRKATWTEREAAAFLAVASQDVGYEPVWTLAVCTGMRRAELLGLRWSDIDWQTGTARVVQTRTKRASTAISKPPKNAGSRRPVPLPTPLLAFLATHKERQELHKAECLDAYEDHDLVCANPYGRHWYPDTITHRFKELVARAGVPALNLHYTRHSYASIALARGAGLRAVGEVLGHVDPTTTIRIYQHVAESGRQAVGESVVGAVMSHLAPDVTWSVTNKEEESPPEATSAAAPEGLLARPIGLEPTTFRSGIGRGGLPLPLTSTRKRTRARAVNTPLPEKTEGRGAG